MQTCASKKIVLHWRINEAFAAVALILKYLKVFHKKHDHWKFLHRDIYDKDTEIDSFKIKKLFKELFNVKITQNNSLKKVL